MGQRLVQLTSTYTGSTSDNHGILHVQQLPPNPAILAPGPALLFVVVNSVPSVGVQVMIGSGQIGNQLTLPVGNLPASGFVQKLGTGTSSSQKSSSSSVYKIDLGLMMAATTLLVGAVGWWL